MHRYELSDEQWEKIAPSMPVRHMGRPRRDDRQMLNAAFWVLHSGAPWRDLPARYGPWQSDYARFKLWQENGLFGRLLAELRMRLDERGLIETGTWMVDATFVRAARPAAGARKKGGRRASPVTTALGAAAGG